MAMKAGTVESGFWTGGTGRALAKQADAQRLACYLITAPTAEIAGLYRLSLETAAHDVGLTEAACRKAMAALEELRFCKYSSEHRWVWVREMCRFQIGPSMKCGDKRLTDVQRLLDAAVDTPFVAEFVARYRDTHCVRLPPAAKVEPPPQSEPAPEVAPEPTKKATAKKLQRDIDVQAVIAHYRTFYPDRCRKMDREKPEWKSINARLDDGYTVDELKSAVTGMCRDDWYVEKGHDTLHMAVRSARKVDEFMAKLGRKRAPVLSEKTKRSVDAGQQLLDELFGEDGTPDVTEVIDVD